MSSTETPIALAAELVEATLRHHLPMAHPDGWVLCTCAETFEGPVYHRRHVASLIVAGEMCEPECGHPIHKPCPHGVTMDPGFWCRKCFGEPF